VLVGVRDFARAKPILLALGEDSSDPTPHLLLYQICQAEGNVEEARVSGALSGADFATE